MDDDGVRFYEAQYMAKDQPLMTIVVWAVSILSWGIFAVQVILGIPVGNNPAPDLWVWLMMIAFGIVFPLFMFSLRLEMRVSGGGLEYRYFPVHLKWKVVPHKNIRKAKAGDYSGLRDFGGWGIRGNRRGRAYTVSGRYGVWITLKDGNELLFGSKKAGDLEKALNEAK